ncbi:hypothetical protein [Alishewanella tabrizica]|nr:hypothetical protein [Alishewanella tabrizica]
MASQATIISHFGYERDSASNIVTGGGLEWLKWDVTKGMSINLALAAHSADGWTLATNSNMTDLYNVFKFGKSDWNNNLATWQDSTIGRSGVEYSVHSMFKSLFGYTYTVQEACEEGWAEHCQINEFLWYSHATYVGSFGGYGVGGLSDQWIDSTDGIAVPGMTSRAYLNHSGLGYGVDTVNSGVGVALVRLAPITPTPVSLPTSVSLLALGLVVLGYRRRQALRP